jgi:site-specific DNA-methyltransferase (adenine-specific)
MKPYELHQGDCLKLLASMPERSVDCCVTSPPYFGLRDYGVDGQIGLEPTPDEFVAKLVAVFREVRRVLRDDGTLWLNLGDSYAGSGKGGNPEDSPHGKQRTNRGTLVARPGNRLNNAGLRPKDLVGIPWRVAFALQADGWYLRQDIIWHKPNPMPESVRDRCTKAHEYIFLLSKSPRYFFDHEAIKEDSVYANCGRPSAKKGSFAAKGEPLAGQLPFRAITEKRNKRSVWTVATKPYKGAHFATYPPALIEPCILAGSREGGTVLDPFNGSGTTGEVAILNSRRYVGIELNAAYLELAKARIDAAVKRCNGLLFQ